MQMKSCFSRDRSIYRPIAGQIPGDIPSGRPRPGPQMRPIRQLSLRYQVNPNTVQRAVDALKRERLLTKQGQGMFVTLDSDRIARLRQRQCSSLVKAFTRDMAALGCTGAEVRQMIRQRQ